MGSESQKVSLVEKPGLFIRAWNWLRNNWLTVLEYFLVVIALFSIILALIALCVWLDSNFFTRLGIYSRQSPEFVEFQNGLKFQVEYPNLVLVGEEDYLRFIPVEPVLPGQDQPVTITVIFPTGLAIVEPFEQAYRRRVILQIDPKLSSISERSIKIVNTRALTGWWSMSQQILIIPDSTNATSSIDILVETVNQATFRDFVNISVDEKSPLILLTTGLLSGAGIWLTQYLKQERERKKDRDEKLEEDLEKKLIQFHEHLKTNLMDGIRYYFLRREQWRTDIKHEEFLERLEEEMHTYPWQDLAVIEAIKKLNDKSFLIREATQIAEYINRLNSETPSYGQKEPRGDLLKILCNFLMAQRTEKNWEKKVDIKDILTAYKQLGDEIQPWVIRLLEELVLSPAAVVKIEKIFCADSDGRELLKACRMGTSLDKMLNEPETKDTAKKAIAEIKKILAEPLRWRSLWPGTLQQASPELSTWLNYHIPDQNANPFGPEYSELDKRLPEYIRYPHPVIEQARGPKPIIIFGEKGSGKTAAALLLAYDCQYPVHKPIEPGVFPVYIRLRTNTQPVEFLFQQIAKALTYFIADNPRSFLNADQIRRGAMGKLMVKYAGGMDYLEASLMHSDHYLVDEVKAIIYYLKTAGINDNVNSKILRDEELTDLLGFSFPAGFNRLDLLIDVPESLDSGKTVEYLQEFVNISLSLARRDIYLKLFVPNKFAYKMGDSSSFHHAILTWTEYDLRGLLTQRGEFKRLCDIRRVTDPEGLMIQAAKGSPRELIRIGNALMSYAETQLSLHEKLSSKAFEIIQE